MIQNSKKNYNFVYLIFTSILIPSTSICNILKPLWIFNRLCNPKANLVDFIQKIRLTESTQNFISWMPKILRPTCGTTLIICLCLHSSPRGTRQLSQADSGCGPGLCFVSRVTFVEVVQFCRGRPNRPIYPDYLNRLPSDPLISYDDEAFYGFQQDDIVKPSQRSENLKKIIKSMEEAVADDEFHGFEDCEIESATQRRNQLENILSQTRSLVSNLRRNKSRTDGQYQHHAWNYDQWLKILDQDFFEEECIKPRNRNNDLMYQLDETENESDGELSFDDTEFLSFSNSMDITAVQMNVRDVSTIEEFHVFFEKHKESVSTPIKKPFKSVTDPALLDTITVMSSSESSLEYEDESDVDCIFEDDTVDDEPQLHVAKLSVPTGPVRLEKILENIHDVCPELAEPTEGRVRDMTRILDNIHEYAETEEISEVTQSQQQSEIGDEPEADKSSRPKRTIQRLDYKMLNVKGASYLKKE